MQEIIFYVAAKETFGIVRNSANTDNLSAPNLVIGVSVCLKMRLFTACDDSTPYPISAFNSIADWNWNMNPGYNRNGEVKLTADPDSITVHSVTDTIDGNTLTFTEFVIPISNMNTQEFSEWFGSEEDKTALNGELVGHDNDGNAVFVLQVKDFTIWNRVGGQCDPTAVDMEIATRSQTLQLIREAVSSSAATKQDKLTSANAGANISISENGIISNTYSMPFAAADTAGGVMLATAAETVSGANSAKAVTPASFMAAITGNNQIVAHSALNAYQTITDFGTASSVSLDAGGAYILCALSGDHYLTVPAVPAGKYGMDAHLELFVGPAALVHVTEPLILMDALVPNAVNNCVIKFRDGAARMFVEDHAYGYVVTVSSGTAGTQLDGSLYCGLTGSTAGYVTFANSLNGQTLDMGGAVTNGEKHVAGNGYSATVLTGGVSCTSKTTFSNLGMRGVSILGGTATLGDVLLSSGATVTANGGMIQLEKVTGGVIDYGGSAVTSAVQRFKDVAISGATLTHTVGSPLYILWNASGTFVSCTFAGGVTSVSDGGGGCYIGPSGNGFFSSCIFSGNSATVGGTPSQVSIRYSSAYAEFKDCTFVGNSPNDLVLAVRNETASATLSGKTTIPAGGVGTHSDNRLTIADGAVIDMTGNLNSLVFYGNIAATGDFSILYTSSAGADTDIRSFHDLGIQGTTITRLGIIYGATVTIPEDLDGTYYIETTEGTTSVTSADAGDLVISSGGLIGTDKD